MSFSKARIQRFNELPSEAPPPGLYDPIFDNRVKGFAIEKTERFQENKSVTSSGGGADCGSSVSSRGTGIQPSPRFRTPQLPKKKGGKVTNVASCPKARSKLPLSTGKCKELKYDAKDELADLKVECANKDRTILDHAKQIEEMKKENFKLENEFRKLRDERDESEERHKNDLESMTKLQKEIADNQEGRHLKEMEAMRIQIVQMTETRQREIQSQRAAEEAMEMRFASISAHAASLGEHIDAIETTSRLEIERLTGQLARVKESKEREIEEFAAVVDEKETELSTVRMEVERLTVISQELREELLRIELDREAEIVHLKAEQEKLKLKMAEAETTGDELSSKLENRQQMVLRLSSQLSGLQCELDEFRAEYDRLSKESESQKISDCVRRSQLEEENERLSKEKDLVTEKLRDAIALHQDNARRLAEANEKLREDHEAELKMQEDNMEMMKSYYDSEKTKLEKLLEDARLEYLMELDNMTVARNNELEEVRTAAAEEKRRIEERSAKMVENAEAVTRETLAACRTESEERVKRALVESDERAKIMAEEARNAVEAKMQEAAKRHETILAGVETEKNLLEKKLEQRDDEIAELSVTLEQLKILVENQDSFSQSLQADLDRVETELSQRRAELRALKDQICSEAGEMVARRRRFEVVMAENQASVAALSQRLSESDAEIERLQNELKTGEDSIVEHRDLLTAMRNNSKILSNEVCALMEKLEAEKSRVDKLESVNLGEIESMRTLCCAKIDELAAASASEITRLQKETQRKDELNLEMKQMLDAMATKLDDALLKMEEIEDSRSIEIAKLEVQNEKLSQKLKEKNEEAKERHTIVETLEAEKKIAIDEADEKIAEMMARISFLETKKIDKEKVKLFQEQQEIRLQEEIALRRASEDEVKKLEELCENLRKSYQDVSDKYAEVIGHNNHKQRVKHLNQLKDKIIRLEKDVETKKHTIDQQSRTIEKLRAEEKRWCAKGKENLPAHGIALSPYGTPVSSPLKPLTPLRNRNE